jgi:predicted RNase H-like HicB family nuclease
VRVRDLVARVEADGWVLVRTKGSHRQFQHSSKPGTVTIAGTGMQYLVVVEEGPTSFGAYVPDLPGCVAAGETREEALALIRDAIEFHIEGLIATGQAVPKPSSTGEVVDIHAA